VLREGSLDPYILSRSCGGYTDGGDFEEVGENSIHLMILDIFLVLNYLVKIGNFEQGDIPGLCWQSSLFWADIRVRTYARYVVTLFML